MSTSNSLIDLATPNHGSHLIVLVNGLWGQAVHWKTIVDCLEARAAAVAADQRKTLSPSSLSQGGLHVHVSHCNQLFDMYDGIDVCGDRLALKHFA